VCAPKRLPESLEARDVAVFVADLATARDRGMTSLILLGGLRAMEVRGLRLSDVDALTLRLSRSLPRSGAPPEPDYARTPAITAYSNRPRTAAIHRFIVVGAAPDRLDIFTTTADFAVKIGSRCQSN
jgi:hypothetical protein